MNSAKKSPIHQIWNVLDGDGPLEGIKTDFGYECILFDVSHDTDDGCYPRVSDWTRFANRLEKDGPSYWINRCTRKKNKLRVPFYGQLTIVREKDWEDEAVLEFDEPIRVVMGYIGGRPTIEKVKKIKGRFYHDWFWTKNGLQSERANGFEIWFEIEEYLE